MVDRSLPVHQSRWVASHFWGRWLGCERSTSIFLLSSRHFSRTRVQVACPFLVLLLGNNAAPLSLGCASLNQWKLARLSVVLIEQRFGPRLQQSLMHSLNPSGEHWTSSLLGFIPIS